MFIEVQPPVTAQSPAAVSESVIMPVMMMIIEPECRPAGSSESDSGLPVTVECDGHGPRQLTAGYYRHRDGASDVRPSPSHWPHAGPATRSQT